MCVLLIAGFLLYRTGAAIVFASMLVTELISSALEGSREEQLLAVSRMDLPWEAP